MRIKESIVLISVAIGTFMTGLGVFAEEVEEYDQWKKDHGDYLKVKEFQGLQFKVPEDYPIKQYEGYVAPIPFEDYAYMKFDKVNKRMEVLEKRILALEEKSKAKEKEKTPEVDAAKKTA